MTLIKSISGIRGTIGGPTGDTLNPLDIVKFTTAYATFMKRGAKGEGRNKIVVGRDARISGDMVRNVVCGTLMGMGLDVIDIDLATTPTTELAVRWTGALGGIIITASHNPRQWNAPKLRNGEGAFLTKDDGNEVHRREGRLRLCRRRFARLLHTRRLVQPAPYRERAQPHSG